MLLVLPREHPLANKRNLRLADLADEAWIGGPQDCECNRLIYGACSAAGYDPRIAFETDDYAAVQGFVAAGVGVSLIAELGLTTIRDDIVVRDLGRETPGAQDLRRRRRRLPHARDGGDARGAARRRRELRVAPPAARRSSAPDTPGRRPRKRCGQPYPLAIFRRSKRVGRDGRMSLRRISYAWMAVACALALRAAAAEAAKKGPDLSVGQARR